MTEWTINSVSSLIVPWPMPGVSSYWEMDIFLGDWNKAVEQIEQMGLSDQQKIEYAVYAWLDSSAAVTLGEEPSRQVVEATEISLNDWENLASRLDETIKKMHEKSR